MVVVDGRWRCRRGRCGWNRRRCRVSKAGDVQRERRHRGTRRSEPREVAVMIRRVLILGALLGAGCKSGAVNDGYAIDLTITADSSVTDDDLARAESLDVEVSGAESFSDPSLSVAGKFD